MDRLTEGAALAVLVSLTLSLSACGGGSSADPVASTPPPPPPPAAQTIDGVSTPSSVAVVTAKNAN